MEKPKREVVIERRDAADRRLSSRTLALVLIGVGALLLLMNAGIFSFHDIGQFFGTLGGEMGRFFGSLGGEIGRFVGSLGGAIGRLWPVVLIALGVALLLRRGRPSRPDLD